MPPRSRSAARMATASPPAAEFPGPATATRLETMTSRRLFGATVAFWRGVSLDTSAVPAAEGDKRVIGGGSARARAGSSTRDEGARSRAFFAFRAARARRYRPTLGESTEPSMQGRHRRECIAGRTQPSPRLRPKHANREPAPSIDLGKAILVRRIIPGIDRAPAEERRFGEERRDGPPLIHAARLELDDFAPLDQSQFGIGRGELAGKTADGGTVARRLAVVERKAAALVFQVHARMVRNE